METMMIRLKNYSMLQQFVEDCCSVDAEFEAVSGDFTANPKSIMGMMTLDLIRPLELRVVSSNVPQDELFSRLSSYAIP